MLQWSSLVSAAEADVERGRRRNGRRAALVEPRLVAVCEGARARGAAETMPGIAQHLYGLRRAVGAYRHHELHDGSVNLVGVGLWRERARSAPIRIAGQTGRTRSINRGGRWRRRRTRAGTPGPTADGRAAIHR